jgi:sRNA-binding protein
VRDAWKPHRPLKVGVDRDLVASGILRADEVPPVMRPYTRRRQYQAALAACGLRFALDGQPHGEVTAVQRACATTVIASIDARATAAFVATKEARREARDQERAKAIQQGRRPPRVWPICLPQADQSRDPGSLFEQFLEDLECRTPTAAATTAAIQAPWARGLETCLSGEVGGGSERMIGRVCPPLLFSSSWLEIARSLRIKT